MSAPWPWPDCATFCISGTLLGLKRDGTVSEVGCKRGRGTSWTPAPRMVTQRAHVYSPVREVIQERPAALPCHHSGLREGATAEFGDKSHRWEVRCEGVGAEEVKKEVYFYAGWAVGLWRLWPLASWRRQASMVPCIPCTMEWWEWVGVGREEGGRREGGMIALNFLYKRHGYPTISRGNLVSLISQIGSFIRSPGTGTPTVGRRGLPGVHFLWHPEASER